MAGIFGRTAFLPVVAAAFALASCGSDEAKEAGSSTTAPAADAKDWTAVVSQTEEGGFRIGNPDAKVELVEFASFTCPHCKEFNLKGKPEILKDYVQSGRVSLEYRPFALNPQDIIAINVASCDGADRFFVWSDALYANQDAWIEPYTKLGEADIARLNQLPPEKQLAGLAEVGKFHEFAKTRGMPKAKFDSCVSDKAKTEAVMAKQQEAVNKYQINGTPSFLINGKLVEGVSDWSALKPKLLDALK